MEKITELPGKGILSVKGADSPAFLQGLLTNDIRQLTGSSGKPKAGRSALLTPQGRVLADLMIIFRQGTFYLITDRGFLPELEAKLRRYRLRAQVDFSRAEEAVYLAWQEADPEAAVGAGEKDTFLPAPSVPGITFYQDSGDSGIGFWGLGLPGIQGNTTTEEWQRHRIKRGLAERPADFLADERGFLLSEINFDWLNGVSFTKGCYLGQEVTARMRYRSLTKKRVIPVIFTGQEKPVSGEKLFLGGQEIGRVLSSYQTKEEQGALCCLKTDFIAEKLRQAEDFYPTVQTDKFFLKLCPPLKIRDLFLSGAE